MPMSTRRSKPSKHPRPPRIYAKLQAYKARAKALEAQLKAYIAAITNVGNDESGQVSTTLMRMCFDLQPITGQGM